MADNTDVELIEDSIATQAAAGITSATSDGVTVQRMSITEQIAAANYIASKTAKSQPHFGLRMTKCIPPGGG
jgi:hypothetical protein